MNATVLDKGSPGFIKPCAFVRSPSEKFAFYNLQRHCISQSEISVSQGETGKPLSIVIFSVTFTIVVKRTQHLYKLLLYLRRNGATKTTLIMGVYNLLGV